MPAIATVKNVAVASRAAFSRRPFTKTSTTSTSNSMKGAGDQQPDDVSHRRALRQLRRCRRRAIARADDVHDQIDREQAAQDEPVVLVVPQVEIGPVGRIVGKDQRRKQIVSADDDQHAQQRDIAEGQRLAHAVREDPEAQLVGRDEHAQQWHQPAHAHVARLARAGGGVQLHDVGEAAQHFGHREAQHQRKQRKHEIETGHARTPRDGPSQF